VLAEGGHSLVHLACELSGTAEMVSLLLSAGADATLPFPDGRPVLHVACKLGDAAVVRVLVNVVDVDQRDPDYRTALFVAARHGKGEVVKVLLEAGADASICDRWGRSPLHAAVFGGDPLSVRLLIDAGLDVNLRSELGETPAFYVDKGSAAALSELIAAGADLSIRNRSGFTPLGWATFRHCDECVRVILAAGGGA
jgi:ankyrin repeat protein